MERYRFARKVAFWLFFAAWFTALEIPTAQSVVREIGDWWAFILAKSLHLGGFAFLAFLGLGFPGTKQGKLAALASVSVLAFVSEALQYLLHGWCGRTGTWLDVGRDHIGIALGAGFWLLMQRWEWTRRITN